MKKRRQIAAGIGTTIIMLILILDSKTALFGAKNGVEMCIYTVVPSLFPFLLLSSVISSTLTDTRSRILGSLGRFCKIPYGCESLLVLGLLGGYPVGAQLVHNAYLSGKLSKSSAQRMLGFCSNAGPAFIFGIIARQFSLSSAPWALWLIHMVSAVLVAPLLPASDVVPYKHEERNIFDIQAIIDRSVKAMGRICCWVIMMRIIIVIMRRWILWCIPESVQTVLIGLLELTNGCLELQSIHQESVRFVVCAGFLSFGGLCVAMQTISVTGQLGTGMYFPGKLLQCAISFLLAGIAQHLLYRQANNLLLPCGLLCCLVLYIVLLKKSKKVVAFLT